MYRSTWLHRFLLVSVVFILAGGISLHVLGNAEEGLKAFSVGKYEKAEALFKEVLKGDAENVPAGYYLGLSLLMQEKFDEALGVFRSLKVNIGDKEVMEDSRMPTRGEVEIGLARTYLGLKKYPEALKMIDAAEKANAAPTEIHTYKGAYYLEINENRKANEELQEALKLNSPNPYTYYFAGIAYLRLGNPQKAVKLFQTFLKMAPYAPEAEHAKFLVDTLC